MTKRILCLLLALTLLFGLTSCQKDREYDQHYYNDQSENHTNNQTKPESTVKPAPVEENTQQPTEEKNENPYAESLEAEFPSSRIECDYQDMLKMKAISNRIMT